MKIALVMLGAALGGAARYLAGGLVNASTRGDFPWGTLAVNLAGCLLMGVLFGLAEKSGWTSTMRAFVFVGVLGGFTTFSSFGLETMRLYQDGLPGQALLYVLASNVLGIGLAWAGYTVTGPRLA